MPRALSVVAIVAAYNEADVIEAVVSDLIANGLGVYVIDDGSTDDTVRLVETFAGRGVIGIERLSPPSTDAEAGRFTWERVLRRKEQLATELDADWILHHDADEFRETPWAGVTLADGVRRVDASGYNAIDFLSLDFQPTHDAFQPGTDVRDAFPWYLDAATYDRVQIRCWKKTPRVDLASSGGHEARFDHRRVFPIRFISRHYPIRGQAHGERKVFCERRPRFVDGERARRWHVQYDTVTRGDSFIRDPCTLRRYEPDEIRLLLSLRHRGVEELESSLASVRADVIAARAEADAAHRDADAARDEGHRLADDVARVTVRLHDLLTDLDALRNTLDARAVELGEARAQMAAFQQRAVEREREIVDLRQQADQLRDALVTRDASLSDARTQVAVRDRELAAHANEIARLSSEIRSAQSHSEALRDGLARSDVDRTHLRHALADAQRRLADLERSLSWRVTGPARALLKAVRGY